MTEPNESVTVAELKEYLEQFEDSAPVAVQASGAYDFLDSDGLKDSAHMDSGEKVVFLDGDKQGRW